MLHFGVMKWVPYVFLGLGGLIALGALLALPAAIRGAPSIPTAGTTGGMTAEQQAAFDAAMKGGDEAQKNAAKQIEAAQKAGAEALAKAGKDVKAAQEQLPEGVQEMPVGDGKEATKPPPPKEKEKEQPKAKEPEKVAAKESAKESPPPARESGGGGGSSNYAQWNSHREQIEKFITDDPLALTRIPGLLEMYKKYEQFVYDADQKWGKATAKKPSERRVNDHLRDAELFGQTDKLVGEMWERMGH